LQASRGHSKETKKRKVSKGCGLGVATLLSIGIAKGKDTAKEVYGRGSVVRLGDELGKAFGRQYAKFTELAAMHATDSNCKHARSAFKSTSYSSYTSLHTTRRHGDHASKHSVRGTHTHSAYMRRTRT
jgi:hypothetical protein